MLMKVVEGIKNDEKMRDPSNNQVSKPEPEKIFITDESALKLLNEQV